MKFGKIQWKIIVLVILVYIVNVYAAQILAFFIGKDRFNSLPDNLLLVDGLILSLCFLSTYYLSGFSFLGMLEMLGLSKGFSQGFLFAFIAALPHLLGQQYLHGFNKSVSFSDIWFMGIRPGYFEEIFFRAFLVGLLARYAGVPGIIPLILSSFLFGLGHLYQAHSFSESIIVFLTAFGAGTGFYLYYKYANWNLWFPLFLHSFMDIATTISNFSGNITMGGTDNIFRGATILSGILFCVLIQYRLRKAERIRPVI